MRLDEDGASSRNMCRVGGEDSRDGRKESYDTIGTIPQIGDHTAVATPGNMAEYTSRSIAEVET